MGYLKYKDLLPPCRASSTSPIGIGPWRSWARSRRAGGAVRLAHRPRSLGSSASRSESPKRLKPNTPRLIAMPGKTAIHGAFSAYDGRGAREHQPPGRRRLGGAQPQVGQGRLGQDGGAELRGQHDDVGRHDVGEDVLQDDAAPRGAQRLHGLDVDVLLDRQGGGPHHARGAGMIGDRRWRSRRSGPPGPGSRRWRGRGSAAGTPAGCPSAARAGDPPSRPSRR